MGCACVSLIDSWFDRFPAGLVFLLGVSSAEPCQLVPRADRDGSEKLSGSERSATLHTLYA